MVFDARPDPIYSNIILVIIVVTLFCQVIFGAKFLLGLSINTNEVGVKLMRTVENIQNDIKALPHEEYMRLVHWFSEQDWKSWDDEIERDSKSVKLDFLFEEAIAEKKAKSLKEL